MKPEHYIRTFAYISESYDHKLPLAHFLTHYFRKNPQMGSKDRKMATALCYAYFRMGNSLPKASPTDRLAIGLFLIQSSEHPVLRFLDSDLAEQVTLPYAEKQVIAAQKGWEASALFPNIEALSAGIDKTAFSASLLTQPDLFIRARKRYLKQVLAKLEEHNCPFEVEDFCIRIPNAQNLKAFFSPDQHDAWFEIQDYSSQQTAKLFQPKAVEHWWDCCAASGGKSLLLLEEEPTIRLTVSDIRDTSLKNLDARFAAAGMSYTQRRVIDLTKPITIFQHNSFDGVIVDAPCSGSGTWGRSPEMLTSFTADKISWFHNLQFAIAKNVVDFIKPGKPMVYITCSVYAQENELLVERLVNELNLKLVEQSLLKGYEKAADSMFTARLIKI